MQLTSTMFLPLLVSTEDTRYGEDYLLEDFTQDLDVGYSFGPPYGNRLVTWDDLDELEVSQAELRRVAVDNLYRLLPRLRIEGQPPAPMLSFGGLESTVLLAAEVWEDLERSVPGELVVGVPARDVVIVTGTASRPGVEKVRRAVDRIFFAGDQNLLSRELLVWRQGGWSTYSTMPEPESGPEDWDDPEPEPQPERWERPERDRWEGAEPGRDRRAEPDRGRDRWEGPERNRDRWEEPEPDRERWEEPGERWEEPERGREGRRDGPPRDRRARWAGPERFQDPEPEPERWRGPDAEPGSGPYRVPRQRSGDGGTTDWPERPPARRSKRRRPGPNGSTR